MNNSDFKNYLNEYSQISLPHLRSYFKSKIKKISKIGSIPATLLERFAAHAERGKMIRGALTVLGNQIAGGKDKLSIYEASIFIEIFHAGLLVHDDIMDGDESRRGLPTIHKQFEDYGKDKGKPLAMLVGDMAFYLSWDKLLNSNFPKENIVKANKIYTKYALNTIYGQVLDFVNNIKRDNDHKDILNIFRFKTAEYTGVLPLLTGAALAGIKDQQKILALEEFGLDLGWAFQIQDDMLGLYGSQDKTGKPIGTDLREGKKTLLVHYVIKNGRKDQVDYLRKILNSKKLTQTDIQKSQLFFKDVGAYDYVLKLGWDYVQKGKAVIPVITTDKKIQNILSSLLEFIMNRTS